MVFSLFFYGQGLLIKMRKEFVILENEALLGELYAYLGMMTWTFFQEILHLTKVMQNLMVTNVYLKTFFEFFCWNM